MLSALFVKKYVWSTALYEFQGPPEARTGEKRVKLFAPPFFSLAKKRETTLADPFLFVHGGRLYLFMERQRKFEIGSIVAHSTADLVHWVFHGTVLEEPFHLSYPHVFAVDEAVYMVPESYKSGAVWLYRAEDFPRGWRKVRPLLEGVYVDCTLHVAGDGAYLWATDPQYRLHLFHAPSLEDPFLPHPCSPITGDPRFSRSAGPLFFSEKKELLRLAQDCHRTYGERIHVLKIEVLSPTGYRETPYDGDLVPKAEAWQKLGVHHFSHAHFGGRSFYAADGLRRDHLVHNFVHAFHKLTTL
jgi:hypothetical protein